MAIVVAPSTGWSECGGHVDSDLQDRLERQRSKTTRVRVPTWEEVKQNLPPGDPTNPRRPTRVIWNLVCSGYQPELAAAWSVCSRALAADTPREQRLPDWNVDPARPRRQRAVWHSTGDRRLRQLRLQQAVIGLAIGNRESGREAGLIFPRRASPARGEDTPSAPRCRGASRSRTGRRGRSRSCRSPRARGSGRCCSGW